MEIFLHNKPQSIERKIIRMKTIGLLAISNVFMAVVWYGQLNFKEW